MAMLERPATTVQFFHIRPSSFITSSVSSSSDPRPPVQDICEQIKDLPAFTATSFAPPADSFTSFWTRDNDDQLLPQRRDLSIPFTFSSLALFS
jgi:hypothetical protein